MERKDIRKIIKKIGTEPLTEEEENQAKLWLFQLNQQDDIELQEEQVQTASNAIFNRLDVKSLKKPVRRLKLTWIAAAAITIITFSISLLYINYLNHSETNIIENIINTGKDGATLTLADGTTLLIDDLTSGEIATQAGVKISKDNQRQITYEIINEPTEEIAFNTLITKRGQQMKIRLPDGSVVFLNASSSLQYPTSFTNTSNRTVSFSGEGYFEITKNTKQPFIVNTGNQRIKVLGTTFNINTYNLHKVTTTLAEGSVMLSTAKESILMKPGEQIENNGKTLTIKNIDLEQVLAWKDGNFVFMGSNIQNIMLQLQNWYDFDVVYENVIVTTPIYASISRDRPISDVLETLEKISGVHFKIQGRRIYVSN